MKKIGIGIFTAPQAGGAYQYTRSVLQAAACLEEFDFTVYSLYPMWKDICEGMGLKFKELSETKLQKALYHMGYVMNKIGKINSSFYNHHPLWKAYDEDGLDLMMITSPSWYGKPEGKKCIMPIFDLMHRYIDFEEVGGGEIGVERDRRYSAICDCCDGILVDSKLGVLQLVDCYGENTDNLIAKTYALPFIVPDYIYDEAQGDAVDVPEKYILYPAQFWKHKNHISLIRAAGELKKQGIEVTLLFTGSGKNAESEINAAIEEYELTNQVVNLGYVTDNQLVYLYRKARAMMFPSFGGPTNIPPLEAMALGCPVAVSDNFAMPEQVGKAGLYFDPDGHDAIKDCMRRLWMDDVLCEKLSAAGLERSKKWTVKEFSKKLGDIISEVLEGGSEN